MIDRLLSVSLVLVWSSAANGQEATVAPVGPPPATLYQIGRPWSHIGSPPREDSAATRVKNWPRERESFDRAFGVIKQSWTGEAVGNSEDLRFQVGQCEDTIRMVTEAGGYGNLVLADALRRLSVGLLSRYIVTHPSEYAAVGDILSGGRINLLDSLATRNMIFEELGLASPSGGHLSTSREEIASIYHADGSTPRDEVGRSLLNRVGPSGMIARRDVSGLLTRLVSDTAADQVLCAFVEFLRRGGTTTDLASFGRLMADQGEKLRLPATIDSVGEGNIAGLIYAVRRWEGKAIAFSELAGK